MADRSPLTSRVSVVPRAAAVVAVVAGAGAAAVAVSEAKAEAVDVHRVRHEVAVVGAAAVGDGGSTAAGTGARCLSVISWRLTARILARDGAVRCYPADGGSYIAG
jgi:hypothetical protein